MARVVGDADMAQAILTHYLMKEEKRDFITLRLITCGTKRANGTSGPERDFFLFEAGQNDGWYVYADDGSVQKDSESAQQS